MHVISERPPWVPWAPGLGAAEALAKTGEQAVIRLSPCASPVESGREPSKVTPGGHPTGDPEMPRATAALSHAAPTVGKMVLPSADSWRDGTFLPLSDDPAREAPGRGQHQRILYLQRVQGDPAPPQPPSYQQKGDTM